MSSHPHVHLPSGVRALGQVVAAAFLVLAVAAVGVPDAHADVPVPTSTTVVSGDGQSAPASTQFAAALVVQVLDQDGAPMSGVPVTFEATGPAVFDTGATFSSSTGSDGTAPSGALFTTAGTGSVEVTATAAGGSNPSTTFHLEVTPPVARLLGIVAGDGPSTIFGYAFSSSLTVQALNELGAPVQPAGAQVDFTIESGAYFVGGATTASVPVGADGQATSPAIFPGDVAGTVRVDAEIRDDNGSTGSAGFELTIETPAPTTVQRFSGDGQTAQIGQRFDEDLSAQVLDQRSQPVAAVPVTFTVTGPAEFASGRNATVDTDAEGVASAPPLTALTSTAGAVDVVATAAGGSDPSTVFHLEVKSPAAASLIVVGGANQVSFRQLQFAAPLVVQALDQDGAPVAPAGATVLFTIESGNAQFEEPINSPTGLGATGAVTGQQQLSPTEYRVGVGANGTAALPGQVIFPTLNPGQNGIVVVSATIQDGNGSQGTTTLLLYVSSAPPTSMSIVSGNGQTATSGAVFGAPLVVNVLDENSFPVVGAPVVFDISSGPALIAGGTGYVAGGTQTVVVTDENGNASVNIGATDGTGPVSISAASYVQSGPSPTPVTFSLAVKAATGTIGGPEQPQPPTSTPAEPTGAAPVVRPGEQISSDAATGGTLPRTGPGPATHQLVWFAVGLLAAGGALQTMAIRRSRPQ